MNSKAQIVATIGPASRNRNVLKKMIEHNMDVARINFSWGTYAEHAELIKTIKEVAQEVSRRIPIIQDLSGPRIQEEHGHEFKAGATQIVTEKDVADLKFGLEQGIDYVAMSFVGSAGDVLELKNKMKELGKEVPVIAKIERKVAVENLEEIIKVSDAIMVARGDLGNEFPLEQIPFVEKDIIEKSKKAGKPVIVATQMMLSMTENLVPTRAEMTDVAYAILSGADAVMLSEESALGKHPVEVVEMMEREVAESEKHLPADAKFNLL